MAKSTLRSLPTLASLGGSKSGGVVKPCRCGCGLSTKSTWHSGHDGRVKGGIVLLLKGAVTWEKVIEVMGRPFAQCCYNIVLDKEMVERWGLNEWPVERAVEVMKAFPGKEEKAG